MTELTTRALNIDAPIADVSAACLKHDITISAIETLLSGGTRVVLMNMEDTNVVHKVFRTKLLKGPVQRTRWVRNQ